MLITKHQFGGRALESSPIYPSIEKHGWITRTEKTEIKWMKCRPTPDEVLDLLSCECKRGSQPEKCSCLVNLLKCTSLCDVKIVRIWLLTFTTRMIDPTRKVMAMKRRTRINEKNI